MTSTNGTFKGEGEDMIAALIAASSAKPSVAVVKALPGERELVPFDFAVGGSATPSDDADATSVAKIALPTPKTANAKVPSPKTSAKTKGKKALPTPRGSSSDLANADPRVRANKVCEPQKPKLTPEQQAAVLAASANVRPKSKSDPQTKVATVNERWANSSFQNAPAPDQLPMPGFLKDLPSAPTPEPRRAMEAPATGVAPVPSMMRQPASAEGLKNLLGVQGSRPPVVASPARTPSGHELFNNMMSSAGRAAGGAPSPPPHPQYAVPMPPPPLYAPHPPPTPPVQHKLNALFGFPAQPFPQPPMYPTTPEGDFQKLMAKLNAGRA